MCVCCDVLNSVVLSFRSMVQQRRKKNTFDSPPTLLILMGLMLSPNNVKSFSVQVKSELKEKNDEKNSSMPQK